MKYNALTITDGLKAELLDRLQIVREDSFIGRIRIQSDIFNYKLTFTDNIRIQAY